MNISIPHIAEFLIELVLFFFAVIVHECAHGVVAEKCGDPTARMLGRITLNPIKHIDPIGTIILPILLKLFGGPIFGWAKPVPVNFYNLRHPRKDMILVAIAGPISNIILASIAVMIIATISRLNVIAHVPFSDVIISLAAIFILLNIILATFNMIPIPPLDGSRVVSGLLPYNLAVQYSRIEPFGFIILLVLLQFQAFNWMFNFTLGLTGTIIHAVAGG
jgi:Zn-dependent protease